MVQQLSSEEKMVLWTLIKPGTSMKMGLEIFKVRYIILVSIGTITHLKMYSQMPDSKWCTFLCIISYTCSCTCSWNYASCKLSVMSLSQESFGWDSGRSTLLLLEESLSFISSWKIGNMPDASLNTDFTLMVQKTTLPFTSHICLEIWLTPWSTTQEWCSPPRTGTMTTISIPTVPTTTQVQQMQT